MNYPETLEYLYRQLPMFQRIGAAAYKKDLDNTIRLCNILGNPQNKFNSIHIAGTNGKGSVSYLLASILQEAGYKTGLYTSPHLKDFRERIRINGKKISKKNVVEFVSDHAAVLEEISPSFFEYTAGMAFTRFNEEKVDIAILETGMGGRLDSTNVVTPLLSVITNIGYDHMTFLGNTLEKIAAEKAGIIKANVPVVIGETQAEAADVFDQKAQQKNAVIYYADKHFRIGSKYDAFQQKPGVYMDIYHDGDRWLSHITCPLSGKYQVKNIMTALQSIHVLKLSGFEVPNSSIVDGIENVVQNTGILGRWQVLSKKPLVICDIGHNEDGIRQVTAQIKSIKYDKLHFVLGTVDDKNIDKILSILPVNARYYFCKANIPRGLDEGVLRKKAIHFGLDGDSFPSVKTAYQSALDNAADKDLVFIGGSTFVVAEIL